MVALFIFINYFENIRFFIKSCKYMLSVCVMMLLWL
jgi:hypothetical protein